MQHPDLRRAAPGIHRRYHYFLRNRWDHALAALACAIARAMHRLLHEGRALDWEKVENGPQLERRISRKLGYRSCMGGAGKSNLA